MDDALTSAEVARHLMDTLDLTDEDFCDSIAQIRTFAQDGIRYNDGLTIRLADGSEYQITVVRSN